MAVRRHLNRAPIREALIDLRVKVEADPAVLEGCARSVVDRYPRQVMLHRGEFGFGFDASGATVQHVDRAVIGYRADSEDGKQVAQFRLDGFTFSRLTPYGTWEQMRDEANRLWAIYRSCLKPEVVTRVAVRFINVMELPVAGRDLSEFLTAPPTLPDALPQAFSSFLARVVFLDPNTTALAILTQAFEGVAGDGKFPLTLDIDAFKDREFDPPDPAIWAYLETLRDLKNNVFFESITETTARLFE